MCLDFTYHEKFGDLHNVFANTNDQNNVSLPCKE